MELQLNILATPAEISRAFSTPRKTDKFSIRSYEPDGYTEGVASAGSRRIYSCTVRLPMWDTYTIAGLRELAERLSRKD